MEFKTTFTENYVLFLDLKNKPKEGDLVFDNYAGINNIQVFRKCDKDSCHNFIKILAYKKLNPEVPDLDLSILPDLEDMPVFYLNFFDKLIEIDASQSKHLVWKWIYRN